MKTYDRVKHILEQYDSARNSDKQLIWLFWQLEGKLSMGHFEKNITFDKFMQATAPESIRRARQKIQEKHPELAPTSEKVRRRRRIKQDTKGTFIYREDTGQGRFL